MSKYKVVILAMFLAALGLSLFVYKVRVLGYPVWPDAETRIWTVETRLSFDAAPGPVKASMFIPGLTPGFSILDENFVSRGFGFTTPYVSGGRQVQWAVRQAAGPQTLYYRAVVYRDPVRQESDTTPPFPPAPTLAEPFNTAMEMLVERVRSQSADPASFTAELLKRLARPGGDQDVELLLGDAPEPVDRARTAMTVLAAASIPARLVRGVRMADNERHAAILPWLEVHDGERWRYFDPARGSEGLPEDFLIWWRGEEPLAQVDGGSDVEVGVSIHSSAADPIIVARRRAEARQVGAAEFSLFALPIQSQAVYAVLLAVPLGALLVVVLRNVIGVQTFGTFMPVLIALAFRETRLLWGVLLFSALVFVGLSIRFYLEKLRLLLVPRLACGADHRGPVDGAGQPAEPPAGLRDRTVGGPVSDGDPDHDHRTHVHRLGGTRPRRRHQAGPGQPAGGGDLLPDHGAGTGGAPDVRVPGTAAGAWRQRCCSAATRAIA